MGQHRDGRWDVLVASMLAAGLLGCGGGGVVAEDGIAAASVGEEIVVPLQVNLGMGDDYEIRAPTDEEVLQFVGVTHLSDDPQADGAWSDAEFRFRAVGAGTTEVVLYNCYRGCIDGVASEPDRGGEVRVEVTISE